MFHCLLKVFKMFLFIHVLHSCTHFLRFYRTNSDILDVHLLTILLMCSVLLQDLIDIQCVVIVFVDIACRMTSSDIFVNITLACLKCAYKLLL